MIWKSSGKQGLHHGPIEMHKFTNSPVLLITYKRIDTTKKVLEAIRKARPKKLYFASNAARPDIPEEVHKVEAVRSLIKTIDWPCEIHTLFRNNHLSAKYSVSSAIDWFFEQEEEGIILEDDCLPHASFFQFCDELLVHYRNDQRIGMISGDNLQFGFKLNDDSYYFSNFNHIWGWASWRSRWQSDYDVEMQFWPMIRDEGRIKDWYGSNVIQEVFSDIFQKVYEGKIDTWDYQWNFCSRLSGRIAIMPNVNLISNIGFGPEATHTTENTVMANIGLEQMDFPLKHPVGIFASNVLDGRMYSGYGQQKLISRVKSLIKKIIGR